MNRHISIGRAVRPKPSLNSDAHWRAFALRCAPVSLFRWASFDAVHWRE